MYEQYPGKYLVTTYPPFRGVGFVHVNYARYAYVPRVNDTYVELPPGKYVLLTLVHPENSKYVLNVNLP